MTGKNNRRLSQEQKQKIGNWLAILVVIVSILVPIGFAFESTVLFWFFIVVNFVAGPACLVGYLMEVRKDIFSQEDEVQ